MVRLYQTQDLPICVQMLMAAYNGEPWRNRWTEETGSRYLREFTESPLFVGWTALEHNSPAGALFARRKTWWTQDELFVDELFVSPAHQGSGHGKQLLQAAEEYCITHALAGVTLLTDRNMPANAFYERSGYTAAGHVTFLYKVVSGSK